MTPIARLALLAAIATAAPLAQAQPSVAARPPVRLIIPLPPGSAQDAMARRLADRMSVVLSQPTIVDNKPGASDILATDAVVKSPADGSVLSFTMASTITIAPHTFRKLPYDPLRDLAPIAIVARTPLVLVVNASSPWRAVNDLISAAKANPKGVRYATFGSGSGPHLAGELFALAAGVKLQDVPYRGSAQSSIALIGGEIEMGIDTVASVAPHVKSGKLRALGIVGAVRSSLLPDIATLAEQKLPEATFDAWYGFAAPARTPAAVVQKLSREVMAVMADPALQAQLKTQGMEPVAIGAPAFRALMENEISRYLALAHRAGIQPE